MILADLVQAFIDGVTGEDGGLMPVEHAHM
jgi:hypothetical protein